MLCLSSLHVSIILCWSAFFSSFLWLSSQSALFDFSPHENNKQPLRVQEGERSANRKSMVELGGGQSKDKEKGAGGLNPWGEKQKESDI